MSNGQPIMLDRKGKRRFACSPVALQAVIVRADERILLLSSPTRNADGAWQTVSGALEAGETVLAGVLRETREEVGGDLRVRALGTLHSNTFRYDDAIPDMIAIYYLLAYESGSVQPGDDMANSRYRWWSLEELADDSVKLSIPPGGKWLLRRAIGLYRLLKDEHPELQAPHREGAGTGNTTGSNPPG